MKSVILISALLLSSLAHAAQFDPNNPDDVYRANTKVFCSLEEGKHSIYWWKGTVYSRVPGEKDRHLFNVHGMNVRACKHFTDPVRGVGSRSVSREVMFFLDPKTNEVVREWTNPWTKQKVEVIQVANDPVNARAPSWSRDEEGKGTANLDRYLIVGDVAFMGGGAARLFYDNPLAGDYQEYVGNNYHASEFLTAAIPYADLMDADATEVKDSVISWGRISRWMPWMKMGSRDGLLVFYTHGLRLESFEDLPEVVKDEIRLNYPAYTQPPPLDDDRPNETSWTVFKNHIDAQREADKP